MRRRFHSPRRRHAASVGTRNDHCARQPDDELAAESGPGARCLDGPAVQGYQTLDQRQTDAKTAFSAVDRGVDLSKHLEHFGNGRGAQADARVAHSQRQLLGLKMRG